MNKKAYFSPILLLNAGETPADSTGANLGGNDDDEVNFFDWFEIDDPGSGYPEGFDAADPCTWYLWDPSNTEYDLREDLGCEVVEP